jgi:hypothetical protein
LPRVDIVCRIGFTKACPYVSCERAGECMAPVAANDNEPGASFTADEIAAAHNRTHNL